MGFAVQTVKEIFELVREDLALWVPIIKASGASAE